MNEPGIAKVSSFVVSLINIITSGNFYKKTRKKSWRLFSLRLERNFSIENLPTIIWTKNYFPLMLKQQLFNINKLMWVCAVELITFCIVFNVSFANFQNSSSSIGVFINPIDLPPVIMWWVCSGHKKMKNRTSKNDLR